MSNKKDERCRKCGGTINQNTGHCSVCGSSSMVAESYGSGLIRTLPIGNIMVFLSSLGGIIGLALVWAMYGDALHSGFEIIAGSLVSISPPALGFDTSYSDYVGLTRAFLIVYLCLMVMSVVLSLINWQNKRIVVTGIILLAFIFLDTFILLLLNSIPTIMIKGMLVLDGKGYHIGTFSLIIGSIGALLNLLLPQVTNPKSR